MEPLKIFDDFHLEKLSESWVKATWEKEFLIIDPIPDDYILFVESNVKDIASLIRDTTKIIKCWIEDNTNDRESQPAELSWQTLSSLDVNPKALLALLGYLMKTGQDRRHDEEDREACLVATSLYLTLLTIPGSSVYEIFHENLFHKALDSLKFSEFISPPERKSRQDIEQLYEEEDEFYLPHAKRKILTEALNTIMYDIILFLKKFSLLDLPRSLEAVVTALIGVTKLGTDNMPLSSPKKQSPSLASLNHNAYAALTDTCHPRHGPIDITMRIIAKNILAFMTNNYYNDLGTKRLTNVRERTIHFLKTLIILHKSPAEDAVLILINLMMINCSKTAEDRKKEVMMIIKLIKICEGKAGEIIKDLVRFSHNNKVTSRIFAQEIINKYLMDGVEDFERAEVKNHRKILLGTVLCHCYDSSSLVRAKALSTIYEYTKIPDNLYVNELFTKEEQNEIPSIEDLEKALENLSIDTDILPDAESIICMLKDRVEDERALVRVFAIQILRNFVAVNKDLLDTTIAIMSKRCRDATMTVRSHAIQLLTSLFESYPNHSGFCAAWVKSVIPQIFDVETKVQAEALNALESLVIKRIASHKENDDLPWRIIRELTKNKMKKHLARACAAWSESAILTKSLVKNIRSQINTENNSEAWVLLSAISRTKILPNMQEYFSNYTQLLESDEFVDPILEVLTICWSKFDENFLEKLYNDFLRLLADFKVNSRLINISLDIVHHVYAFLLARGKPQKRTFKGEMKLLIKLSEAIIDKTAVVEVDEKIFDRAIRTLGNAPMLCTAEISMKILRVLQGYLLDSDMLPKWLKSPRKMQASTIITLGQCSIRDESIAHEMTPIFAKLLSSKSLDDPDEDAAVRVNAAKALADICIIFTSLVEPHLPDICVSMKDSNPAVRQTIVVIFIQLLVEDYIKVKGNFLFHILTMLTDEDPTIRDMTIFLIKERLLRKNKEIIGLQFFEAILHYNDFELPNQVCKREMREFEKESLLLAGKTNEKKRRIIYDFMLEHLEPGLKLKLISTIVTKIFNGIISGNIKLKNEAAIWVFKDSLYVVSHEQLQVGSRARQDEEDEEGGGSFISSSNILLEKLKNNVLILLLSCMVDLRKKLKKTEFQETVSKSFLRIIGELGKEKLQALLSEYPKIDAEFERNCRLYGRGNEFEQETEDSEEPIGESLSTNTANQLLLDNRTPRVVLKRLSL